MGSTSITGDGRGAIEKTISVTQTTLLPSNLTSQEGIGGWEEVFEIPRCVQWVNQNSFKRICLQFPDEYLTYSPRIVETLEKVTGQRCYILADSTYGSCCVDEKTAQHVPDADSLIHFGQSCLSPCSGRLPVLYVFTRPPVDLSKMDRLFNDHFTPEEKVIIIYDVIYQHAATLFFNQSKSTHNNLRMSELVMPEITGCVQSTNGSKGVIKHGRQISVEDEADIENYKIFFIGSRALPNLLLDLPKNTFKVYDPTLSSSTETLSTQTSSINKLIRKRNFYVEKIKDATSVGILVGTLVVQNYLSVIERLKTILRKVGKKFYVVSIGEINPCKLANFMDIECFVFVGCPEVVNYYLSDESKGQFFQPILTPYDVELAFCSAEDGSSLTGQEYIIDWAFLIEKGDPNVREMENDMSLITGGLRSSGIREVNGKGSANQVINWVGLDVNEESPSTDPSQVHQGRSGIASYYVDEPKTLI